MGKKLSVFIKFVKCFTNYVNSDLDLQQYKKWDPAPH